jgi:hypothetical protein
VSRVRARIAAPPEFDSVTRELFQNLGVILQSGLKSKRLF